MRIDDVNDMIYYFGEKYGFDPFAYEINLLTGIVSERKQEYISFASSTMHKIQEMSNSTPTKFKPKPLKEKISRKSKPSVEKLENGATLYRLNQTTETQEETIEHQDHLPEFRRWIAKNGLDLVNVRKMISSIEQYKRIEEISPNTFYEKPEEIIELQEWIESNDLDYLKLRMMIAILAQDEANLYREMAVAR